MKKNANKAMAASFVEEMLRSAFSSKASLIKVTAEREAPKIFMTCDHKKVVYRKKLKSGLFSDVVLRLKDLVDWPNVSPAVATYKKVGSGKFRFTLVTTGHVLFGQDECILLLSPKP